MFPTIHNYKGDDLDSRGYGALSDCISAEVTEELNGGYTLELKYPLHGIHNEYLIPSNIIMCSPNHTDLPQAFRINQVRKSFANSITVYANHICYDLSGYPMRDAYNCNNLAEVITAMNNAIWNTNNAIFHQFTFDTNMTSSTAFSMDAIQTLRSWMGGQEGSVIDTYGGEWHYNNYQCHLMEHRGKDNGVRISYGVNLAEYGKEHNNILFSHVCAYWKQTEEVAYGDLIPTGIVCPFRCDYYDASNLFETMPTTTQLNAVATSRISSLPLESKTIKVTPVQLGSNMGLGDTVQVCYEDVFTTRVIKTVWDALGSRYTSVELGTKKAGITDTIKSLSQNSNDDTQTFRKLSNISGNGSKTVSIPPLFRGTLFVYYSGTAMGVYMVSSTSSNNVYVTTVKEANGTTITTANGSITISNSASTTRYVYYLGNATLK